MEYEIKTYNYNILEPVIVIPMAGASSRFFNAGYAVPKYKLPLGNETLFDKSVRSFEQFFDKSVFVFIIRDDDEGAYNFVQEHINYLQIKKSNIVSLETLTKGQAETVFLGLIKSKLAYSPRPLIIFNIDSIRKNFVFPTGHEWHSYFDAFYNENADESKWSFCVEKNGKIIRTAEKHKISNWCSTGLYLFGAVSTFMSVYLIAIRNYKDTYNYYIAPLYNYMIPIKDDKNYHFLMECPPDDIEFAGVPDEYETLKIKYKNEEKIA